jgi:hypothetical protein
MRVLIGLLTCIFLFASCKKAEKEKVVYTSRDSETDFSKFRTYYISDTLVMIDNKADTLLTDDSYSQGIVLSIKQNMAQRGFLFAHLHENPDFGICVSVSRKANVDMYYSGKNSTSFYDYYFRYGYNYPYYYPFRVYIPNSRSTIIIDMVDIKHAAAINQNTVVWNAIMSGPVSYDVEVNLKDAAQSINKAFLQSSYLKR